MTLSDAFILTQMIVMLGVFAMQVANFVRSQRMAEHVEEIKHATNSLMDQRVAAAEIVARAAGVREGREI
jgi:hypothetical protein